MMLNDAQKIIVGISGVVMGAITGGYFYYMHKSAKAYEEYLKKDGDTNVKIKEAINRIKENQEEE